MTTKDISTVDDPSLRNALDALPSLKRAALKARKIAIQTDTNLVVMVYGKLTRISAKELKERARLEESETE